MANLFNGDYTITDDNGDLEIKDSNGNVVLRHNETNDEWELPLSLIDSDSSNTIYDDSTETFGDGNQKADITELLSSVAITDLTDSSSSNTVYDSSAEQIGDGNQDASLNALLSSLQILSLTDSNSGNTVYDESTETLGDGNQSLNVNDGTVDSDELIGFPSSTSSISPGFDSWTTADANRPTLVIIHIHTEVDGNSFAEINVDVDESGGTTADYTFRRRAPDSLDAGEEIEGTYTIPLPPAAQFQIRNTSDPNSNNSIEVVRKMTL